MDNTYNWYATLIKPTWAPPSWLFAPVWTILYLLIAVSFLSVFYKVYKGKLSKATALPFILNLFFNSIFTFLQFGLKNNLLAAIDILLVLITIIWMFKAVWPRLKWIVWTNLPYLLWVSFATILQLTVTYLNWK